MARKVLQSLEGMKLVEKDTATGGRKLTPQGRKDLDRIAAQVNEKLNPRPKKRRGLCILFPITSGHLRPLLLLSTVEQT